MDNIAKYNLKTVGLSAIGLIVLSSILSYLTYPKATEFDWHSLNPFVFWKETIVALESEFGLHIGVAIILSGLLSFLLFVLFLWIIRRILK